MKATMRPLTVSLSLILTLFSFEQCFAQLCSAFSFNPHKQQTQQMRADYFLSNKKNLEFQNDKPAYTKLFVAPKYLNVRDSPDFGTIVGTVFRGQKLDLYARKDNWVAISRDTKEGMWVHVDYLSMNSTSTITYENLLAKCSLTDMAEFLDGSLDNSGCMSVRTFLKQNDFTEASRYFKLNLVEWLEHNNREKALNKVRSNCY